MLKPKLLFQRISYFTVSEIFIKIKEKQRESQENKFFLFKKVLVGFNLIKKMSYIYSLFVSQIISQRSDVLSRIMKRSSFPERRINFVSQYQCYKHTLAYSARGEQELQIGVCLQSDSLVTQLCLLGTPVLLACPWVM